MYLTILILFMLAGFLPQALSGTISRQIRQKYEEHWAVRDDRRQELRDDMLKKREVVLEEFRARKDKVRGEIGKTKDAVQRKWEKYEKMPALGPLLSTTTPPRFSDGFLDVVRELGDRALQSAKAFAGEMLRTRDQKAD